MAKSKKETKKSTWQNFKEETMNIYGNEFEGKKGKTFVRYSVSIGTKDPADEDNYVNTYLDVIFCGDNRPDETGKMTITATGFVGAKAYVAKDGKTVVQPAIYVTDWEEG